MHNPIFLFSLSIFILCTSCESEQERTARLQREEQQRVELAAKKESEERDLALRLEQEKVERELQLEKERKEKEIYDKYIGNSLKTGSTPYAYCYGANKSCSEWGCSQIEVKTPYNSDVLVTIKKNDGVFRHAFIKASSSYTFEVPNGTYQPFFYYGKGWNPEKFMKTALCGDLKGGFIANEDFGKDFPQVLDNSVLSYELILQQSGNFSTKPSNQAEAL